MKTLKTALVIIIATIKLSATTAPIEPTDAIFNGKTAYQLKQMAADAMNALAAGGGGAGPAAAESAALAQCITSGDNTPYINLAKEAVKAKLAVILGNDKAVLKNALDEFIERLDNTTVVLAPPSAPDANPAHATDAHLQSARKAAIEMAMVQKVNEEIDSLGTATGVAQPIKNALMAVFAGR